MNKSLILFLAFLISGNCHATISMETRAGILFSILGCTGIMSTLLAYNDPKVSPADREFYGPLNAAATAFIYLVACYFFTVSVKAKKSVIPQTVSFVRAEVRNEWQERRPAYEQTGLRKRILASAQQSKENTSTRSTEEREAIDIAGPADTLPLFLNRKSYIELLQTASDLNPLTRNIMATHPRLISAALQYWQERGLSIETIIERLLEADVTSYENHTVLRNEAYAVGDSLGLAPQEVDRILLELPEKFIEIADLLVAMSREPLDDSLLMPGPTPQTME